jgi:hypothetical protein
MKVAMLESLGKGFTAWRAGLLGHWRAITVPRNLGKSGFDEINPAYCRYTQKAFNGLIRTGIAAMLLSGKVS